MHDAERQREEPMPAEPTDASSPAAATDGSVDVTEPAPPPEPSPLEIARRLALERQPPPWNPTAKELDPDSDVGWEKAAAHELPAIRPEDLPALEAEARAREEAERQAQIESGAAEPDWAAAEAEAARAAALARLAADPALSADPSMAWAQSTMAGAPAADAQPAMGQVISFDDAVAAAPAAPKERVWRRAGRGATRRVRRAGSATKRGLEAAARPVLILALFGLGVSAGWWTWVRTLPPVANGAVAPAAQLEPGTTNDTPPQVQSLVAALNSDNQTQVQTVVPAEPYRLLAGELAANGIQKIQGARALQTFISGTDSATEILIGGVDTQGNGMVINIVVHVHDGAISEFR